MTGILMDFYKSVAYLTESAESGKSYKNRLYSVENKKNIKSLHYLSTNCVKKKKSIDELLKRVGFDDVTWIKRVLLYEYLWGKRKKILQLRTTSREVDEIIKNRAAILKNFHHLENEKIVEDETGIPRYIRINLEKLNMRECEEILKKYNFQNKPSPKTYETFVNEMRNLKTNEYLYDFHVPNLIVFSHTSNLKKLPQCSFIRQDKASCLVVPLLAPLPGSSILDMCAAPGLKTQHAASYIFKLGHIYSIDINKERFLTLKKTIKTFSLEDCCTSLNKDVLKVGEELCPNVEYILLDAPCSGTGMSNTLIKHTASKERLSKLHNLQVMLLKHALKNFPCVRRIVYSTCSVTEEENEQVISECLDVAREAGFQLVPLSSAYKGSFHSGKGDYPCSSNVIRTSPDFDLTNGFFVALFERTVPPKLPQWKEFEYKNDVTKEKNSLSTENTNSHSTSISHSETMLMKKEGNIRKRKKKKKNKTLK